MKGRMKKACAVMTSHKVEAIYLVLVGVSAMSPAYAAATTLKEAMLNLLKVIQVAGVGMIALSAVKWGIEFLQGGGGTREAFISLGIGAGLILGALSIAQAI